MTARFWVLATVDGGGEGYRGVDRPAIGWHGSPSEEYDRAVDQIAERSDGFANVAEANSVAARLRDSGVSVDVVLDVIEPVNGEANHGGHLLGYDVTYFSYHSMLSDGLRSLCAVEDRVDAAILRLMYEHFVKCLNKDGLFDTLERATQFRDCAVAMKKLAPALFEDAEGFVPTVHELRLLSAMS